VNARSTGVIAEYAKLDGIIVPAQFLNKLRGFPLLKAATGIRPWGYPADDQQNPVNIKDAIHAGADYLIVGRPITQPLLGVTPAQAARQIVAEIEVAMKGRR